MTTSLRPSHIPPTSLPGGESDIPPLPPRPYREGRGCRPSPQARPAAFSCCVWCFTHGRADLWAPTPASGGCGLSGVPNGPSGPGRRGGSRENVLARALSSGRARGLGIR